MLTVKQLMAQLKDVPEDLEVLVYDLATTDSHSIEQVDTDLGDRIDLNIDTYKL